MNANAPRQLLSATARFTVASVAVVGLAAAWVAAASASHIAVDNAYAAVNSTRVTLQTVEIVAQRERPAQQVAGSQRTRTAY